MQRRAEIVLRRAELEVALAVLLLQIEQLEGAERTARDEASAAPTDGPLTSAYVAAASAAREFVVASGRLEQSRTRFPEIEATVAAARTTLADAATDVQLPQGAHTISTRSTAVSIAFNAPFQCSLPPYGTCSQSGPSC